MKTSSTIEKSFLKYINEMGETPGGFLGFLNAETLENGDPKKITNSLGKEMQMGADILENGANYMDFQPWEMEKGKAGSRLIEAIHIYREIGKEIEQMKEESTEYQIYIIAILIDIVSSLINHIEIHMTENHE